jgi:hypothetical protein
MLVRASLLPLFPTLLDLLLAMKICSIVHRDKEHKRIKDFCDLTALCLYGGVALDELKKELYNFVGQKKVKKNLSVLDKDDYARVVQALGVEETVLVDLVRRLSE